jgi:hypothetical protein
MLKRGLLSFFFISLLSVVRADQGCYISPYVYRVASGSVLLNPPGGVYEYDWYQNYSSSSSDRVLLSSVYCVVSSSLPGRVGGYFGTWGTTITFSMVQCPLDDYIWLLMLPVGFFAFRMIRRTGLNLDTPFKSSSIRLAV